MPKVNVKRVWPSVGLFLRRLKGWSADASLPVVQDGGIDQRSAVNAFVGVKDDEKIGYPFPVHQPLTFRALHGAPLSFAFHAPLFCNPYAVIFFLQVVVFMNIFDLFSLVVLTLGSGVLTFFGILWRKGTRRAGGRFGRRVSLLPQNKLYGPSD